MSRCQENARNMSPYCTAELYFVFVTRRYDLPVTEVGCETRSQNTRKWRTSGIINP